MSLLSLILIIILISFVLLLSLLYGLTLLGNLFFAAPFLPSNRRVVKIITEQIDLSQKKKFYELGSGDGRIIARLAQKYPQLECCGVELSWLPYLLARCRNLFLKRKVKYHRQDLFKTDLTEADVVFVYLLPRAMTQLESKFAAELQPGAWVISNTFPLKNKKTFRLYPGQPGSLSTVYLYRY